MRDREEECLECEGEEAAAAEVEEGEAPVGAVFVGAMEGEPAVVTVDAVGAVDAVEEDGPDVLEDRDLFLDV